MKLFDEMEKCFPEIEKHWKDLYDQALEYLMTASHVEGLRIILKEWIIETYLADDSELYQLFCLADFENKMSMAGKMVEWMYYVRSTERNSDISQTDTFPVQE